VFPLFDKPTGSWGFLKDVLAQGCTGTGDVIVQAGSVDDTGIRADGTRPSATSPSDISSRFQLDELRANQMQNEDFIAVDDRHFNISFVGLASNPRYLKFDFVDVAQNPLAPTSIGKMSTLQPSDLICSERGV
jgi:hypothetical protein